MEKTSCSAIKTRYIFISKYILEAFIISEVDIQKYCFLCEYKIQTKTVSSQA